MTKREFFTMLNGHLESGVRSFRLVLIKIPPYYREAQIELILNDGKTELSLAKVGINALVDEATGYQEGRDSGELARMAKGMGYVGVVLYRPRSTSAPLFMDRLKKHYKRFARWLIEWQKSLPTRTIKLGDALDEMEARL